jgi:ribonuclease HI
VNDLQKIEIATDGACSGNPGPGGWGALLRYGDIERELSGFASHTTNNRMELMGPIEALKSLKRPCQVTLFTDSQYVQRGMTEWIFNWKRNGWRKKAGSSETIANADLWEALDAEAKRHKIEWRWVRGHSGDADNERVDAIARAAIANGLSEQKLSSVQ